MANWAIVVGINEYWDSEANLRYAVRDAIKMTEWLTDPQGGNVAPTNLFLLTHPLELPADAKLPTGIEHTDANKNDLVTSIFRLISKSRGKGERLFFYFSGHGLTKRDEISSSQALVMADFTEELTDNSIILSSLWEYFLTSQFSEQFFFMDACRNALDWDFDYNFGSFPRRGRATGVQYTPSQFLLYATSPGLRAAEINEGGAFTGVLLDGLKKGAGTSKFFNSAAREYQVPVNLLLRYVRNEIEKKKIVVSEPSHEPPIYQAPSISIPNSGGVFPVLARFKTMPEEDLEIYVEPSECWGQAAIIVSNEIGQNVAQIKPVTEAPLKALKKLPPMTYTIRAEAPPFFEPEEPYWAFDLYEPTRTEIKLRAVQLLLADAEPFDSIYNTFTRSDSGYLKKRLGKLKKGTKKPPKITTATLTVTSKDPLAPLEITDNNGVLKAGGNGRLFCSGLEPGVYRARLVTPENAFSEKIVQLQSGDKQTVSLEAPPPPETFLFHQIIKNTAFDIRDDKTLSVSEYVGRMATAQLTTIMTLAGSVVRDNYGWSDKTRQLGLIPFQTEIPLNTTSGLRVVFADEFSPEAQVKDYLSQIEISLWRQNETESKNIYKLKSSGVFNRIAEFTREAVPDSYFLSITMPNRRPAIFSVSVLPERMTLFVIHLRADASLAVLGFSSSFEYGETPKETSKNLRRLELLQRFYQNNNIGAHAYRDAVKLLNAKWLDPFAGCLGGYTMLNLNEARRLNIAAENMVNLYGDLSDSHILKAEYLLSEKSEAEAIKSYKDALRRGVPIFAQGLERLYLAIERYKIKSLRVGLIKEAFENRARGILWTVWTLPSFLEDFSDMKN